MSSLARAVVGTIIGIWMLGTLAPNVSCVWQPCPSNGLSVDYDGIVTGVDAGSPAAQAALVPGDRIATPLPRDLFREPQQPLSFTLVHAGTARPVKLDPKMTNLGRSDALRLLALCASYLIFLIVGSGLLLLRPSAMTWSFYLYCVLRRYGDLWFYWPGSNAFFWFNVLALGTLGGASCALVTIFALRFPNNQLHGWRRPLNRIAVMFALLLPAAWLYAWVRIDFLGLPGQALIELLILVTSIVYLSAAAIFIVTLVRSRGEERQRMQWILIFPVVLILHVVAINSPNSFPAWFSDALLAVAVCIPLTVAYAVVRRRVFDIEFVISRALVYGTITSIIAGTFLLLDWFLSKDLPRRALPWPPKSSSLWLSDRRLTCCITTSIASSTARFSASVISRSSALRGRRVLCSAPSRARQSINSSSTNRCGRSISLPPRCLTGMKAQNASFAQWRSVGITPTCRSLRRKIRSCCIS